MNESSKQRSTASDFTPKLLVYQQRRCFIQRLENCTRSTSGATVGQLGQFAVLCVADLSLQGWMQKRDGFFPLQACTRHSYDVGTGDESRR